MSQITSACGFAYRRHFYSNFIPCASFFSSICRRCLRSILVILWRSVCKHRLFNKFGQTSAIVLRGGCPYFFHCLRVQPQGEPDFVFYRFHFPFFPTSFRPRRIAVSDIAARHRRDFCKLPKTPRKPPFRSALPCAVIRAGNPLQLRLFLLLQHTQFPHQATDSPHLRTASSNTSHSLYCSTDSVYADSVSFLTCSRIAAPPSPSSQ